MEGDSMTVTLTKHQPWCHNHTADRHYADSGVTVTGYCESRTIEAGAMQVTITAVADADDVVVEVSGPQGLGQRIEVEPADVKALIGALLWAQSQVQP